MLTENNLGSQSNIYLDFVNIFVYLEKGIF